MIFNYLKKFKIYFKILCNKFIDFRQLDLTDGKEIFIMIPDCPWSFGLIENI